MSSMLLVSNIHILSFLGRPEEETQLYELASLPRGLGGFKHLENNELHFLQQNVRCLHLS